MYKQHESVVLYSNVPIKMTIQCIVILRPVYVLIEFRFRRLIYGFPVQMQILFVHTMSILMLNVCKLCPKKHEMSEFDWGHPTVPSPSGSNSSMSGV